MSSLKDLIAEFCPNGVEFKPLGELVCKIEKISWKNTTENFLYIDLSSVDIDSHKILKVTNINQDNAPDRAQQILKTDDVLFGSTRPMLKRYCSVPKEYDRQICSTVFCVLRANTKLVLPRWLYHNIASTNFFIYAEKNQRGTSYPMISDKEYFKV